MTAVATRARRAAERARPFGPTTRREQVSRLRTLPLPDTEPPIERGDILREPVVHPAQGVLALLPAEDDDEALWGPQPTPSHELPDPARWARVVTQLIVEVLAGHRPSAQLVRWTSEQVYRDIRQRAVPLPSGRDRSRSLGPAHRPKIGGVRVSEPRDSVAEVAVVVHRRHRVLAMALRLEGRDGRWVVTVLQHG